MEINCGLGHKPTLEIGRWVFDIERSILGVGH